MAADFKRAEQAALQILEEYRISAPPIDPEEIAEKMGVNVTYAKFGEPYRNEVSGFISFSDNGSAEIVINSDISVNRKIFTIAHELGHYVLHREWAKSDNYVLPRVNDYNEGKPDEEREADAFAANLLVPEGLLRKYADISTADDLSEIFLVSNQVIENRLNRIKKHWWRYGR